MKIKINDKKKMIRGIIVLVLGILIIVGVVILIMKLTSPKVSESGLKKKLEKEGRVFYEEYFYNNEALQGLSEEQHKEYVKTYEEIGFKISLYTLATYNKTDASFLNEFVNPKTKKPCDENETKVIIYPKEPYDNKSYKIEVQLSCE